MKKLIVKSLLKDAEEFLKRMAGVGSEFSPVVWQHERIYVPHGYRPEHNMPRMVLRTEVRATDQPAKYSLFLKRHIEDSGVDWVNATEVLDYAEASGIVHQLGFKKQAEVSRQRRELWLDAKTVVYFDKVEGLDGAYVKIEAELTDDEAVAPLRADLLKVLAMMGQETFLMQTYGDLLKGDEAEEFVVEH